MHRPLRMAVSPARTEPHHGNACARFAVMCPRIPRRRDETWSRIPLIAVLLYCLVFLVPLAAASPPDPMWIPGIYDAADSDDVVVAATSPEGRVEGGPLVVSPVTMVAYILPVARVGIPIATAPRSVQSRSPPKTVAVWAASESGLYVGYDPPRWPELAGEENLMRTMLRTLTMVLGVMILGAVFAPTVSAQCGYINGRKAAESSIQQQSWQGQAQFRPASLLLVSDNSSAASIVGFWKVKFVAQGNPSAGPPDGTLIDQGFAQWHSDGTEILNSSRPAASGNFCLGVWKKTGAFHYTLNHFALSSDPATDTLNGTTQIREEVELAHGADTYAGTFTIDVYDVPGNLLAHIVGDVTATRVTVDTSVEEVL